MKVLLLLFLTLGIAALLLLLAALAFAWAYRKGLFDIYASYMPEALQREVRGLRDDAGESSAPVDPPAPGKKPYAWPPRSGRPGDQLG